MKLFSKLLIALSAALVASTAHADPTTYRGKLGSLDIVVELSADPADAGGPVFGRYLYLNKGVDIPLHAVSRDSRAVLLQEEEPCGADLCGNGESPPLGATWRLQRGPDGKLTGTWKGKRELKLELVRAGSRFEPTAPETPRDLFSHSEDLDWNGDPITLANEPYDHLRLDVPPKPGETLGWPGATYSFAADPRIGYLSPVILEVAGRSPDRANAVLRERLWRASLSAFNCAALQYATFSEGGMLGPAEGGSFGGWDTDSFAEVTALTPALMGWTESGSRYCGGAHPYNYANDYVLDVASGELLSLGDMFEGAADDGPGERLAAFVRDGRQRPVPGGFDEEHDRECGIDELIGEYLSVSLRRDGDDLRVVFGLSGLPHAINACADDLLDVAAADVRDLVTPRFAALLGL
jgi:hypothetical protein